MIETLFRYHCDGCARRTEPSVDQVLPDDWRTYFGSYDTKFVLCGKCACGSAGTIALKMEKTKIR